MPPSYCSTSFGRWETDRSVLGIGAGRQALAIAELKHYIRKAYPSSLKSTVVYLHAGMESQFSISAVFIISFKLSLPRKLDGIVHCELFVVKEKAGPDCLEEGVLLKYLRVAQLSLYGLLFHTCAVQTSSDWTVIQKE